MSPSFLLFSGPKTEALMTYEITLKGSLCMTVTTLSKIQETLLEQRAQTYPSVSFCTAPFLPHTPKNFYQNI